MKPGDKVIITKTSIWNGSRSLGGGVFTGMVATINNITEWGGLMLFVNCGWYWCGKDDVEPLSDDAILNYAENYVINIHS